MIAKRNHKPIGHWHVENEGRAQCFKKVLDEWRETFGGQSAESGMVDMLACLAHYCDNNGLELADVVEDAMRQYQDDTRAANARECNGAQFDRITVARKRLR